MPINNGIINQKGTPAFYSDIFANRPAFGYAGRVFISTDTGAIYEDTGSAWTLIADAGAGTTGTLQQVTTNGNTTTLGVTIQGININDGAGTGLNNIVIGGGLQSNTTGTQNTAIGIDSLVINTTGFNNTALGGTTLNNNTTGNNNTAIGYSSLQANTIGTGNNAVGTSSLLSNTTGINNTAIGSSTLTANTTGRYNVAIGNGALTSNTTAEYNTAIGFNSLSLNTTGLQNTAIGSVSLGINTTGGSNTAIGHNSLGQNSTASFNTAIGYSSLAANTTGTLNTAIGYSAGSLIATGSNNTILGNYTGTPTLASNIVLADGNGNVRLFSDANGLIGINQAVGSTIGGQLDIHSTQTYALVLNGLSTSNAYTAFSNASVGKWRIGNTYNAGANSFDIFNLGTSSNALSFNSTTNVATFTGALSVNVNGSTFGLVSAGSYPLTIQTNTSEQTIKILGKTTTNNSDVQFFNSTGATFLAHIGIENTDFVIGTGTSGTTRLNIKSGGNVLIGSSTDDTINKLQVTGQTNIKGGGTITSLTDFNSIANTTFALANPAVKLGIGYNASDIPLIQGFDTSNAARNISINPYGGAVGIGNLAGTGSRAVLADANGYLSAPVSDISVKENINAIGYGLSHILKMNPVWFNYIDEYKNYGEGRQNGNIAQEMEAIIPEAVFTTPTTGKMGINYDQLHAVYIKAIQELKAEIDALKNN